MNKMAKQTRINRLMSLGNNKHVPSCKNGDGTSKGQQIEQKIQQKCLIVKMVTQRDDKSMFTRLHINYGLIFLYLLNAKGFAYSRRLSHTSKGLFLTKE